MIHSVLLLEQFSGVEADVGRLEGPALQAFQPFEVPRRALLDLGQQRVHEGRHGLGRAAHARLRAEMRPRLVAQQVRDLLSDGNAFRHVV